MKIAILDDYQDVVRHLACFGMLEQHEVKIFTNRAVGTGQLAIRLAQFDAVVLIRERSRFARALLQKLPQLKLISQTGKLAGHVDTAAARDCGIAITEGRGDPTAPAELTWTLIMAASRRLLNYASLLQEGCWQMSSSEPSRNRLGRVLKQRVLGIWGYGRIGKLVAGYGKAFGMQVLVWGSAASQAQARADGYQIAATRAAFFADSDVISLHLRLNDATQGIVKLEDLSRMKRDALFVNTSRAELVAATALETALSQGRPGFAALDVFETEPPAAGHALLRYENVLATPHLGYVEQDSYELYFSAAFQNILDFAAGTPSNLYTGA